MPTVNLPSQHAAHVKEVCRAVPVAALLRQFLQYPVAVGCATIQQQRNMVLHNRYLNICLTGQRANTCRTGKLLHICLL